MKKNYRVAIVGAGERLCWLFECVRHLEYPFEVAAVVDLDEAYARHNLEKEEIDVSKTKFYTDIDRMMDETALDGVMIGTRCNFHTPLALKVMARNIPLFLEKPVAVSPEQIDALYAAYRTYEAQSVVSFPLRYVTVVEEAKKLYRQGLIGKLSQVQACNNVNYGRVYYKHWYQDSDITGGLFLQKATHDVDYINDVVGMQPVSLFAMDSRGIFGGDEPAGKKCCDCDKRATCPESDYVIEKVYRDAFPKTSHELCPYTKQMRNQESGTILMRYPDGTHCVYTQNFIVREKCAKRGARLIGELGTIEFDMVTNELTYYDHRSPKVTKTVVDESQMGHGGGDLFLIRDFVQAMEGIRIENSVVAGIQSAEICCCAERSARSMKHLDVRSFARIR